MLLGLLMFDWFDWFVSKSLDLGFGIEHSFYSWGWRPLAGYAVLFQASFGQGLGAFWAMFSLGGTVVAASESHAVHAVIVRVKGTGAILGALSPIMEAMPAMWAQQGAAVVYVARILR